MPRQTALCVPRDPRKMEQTSHFLLFRNKYSICGMDVKRGNMQIIDPKHKFYRPLWVRVLVVLVCASWFAVELYMGPSFWLVIMGALTVYTAWVLLIRFEPAAEEPPKASAEDQPLP